MVRHSQCFLQKHHERSTTLLACTYRSAIKQSQSCPEKRRVLIELYACDYVPQASISNPQHIFKSCWHSNGSDDMSEDGFYGRRVCPGDEDGKRWTGEPGIDGRASAFIARFYATRVSDPERQTLAL
ncbi:hypothetical protein DKX38_014861 [Salix brachista]|uniref:Uncharacterized protein n=1 Tax=Salix brachista TaxID=2182728 RepID=A0A5N5L4A6_9ROSI|nr:hypothetical protein DKX38_014861 [Salix brachista]